MASRSRDNRPRPGRAATTCTPPGACARRVLEPHGRSCRDQPAPFATTTASRADRRAHPQTELIRRWGEMALPGRSPSRPTSSRPTVGRSVAPRWPMALSGRTDRAALPAPRPLAAGLAQHRGLGAAAIRCRARARAETALRSMNSLAIGYTANPAPGSPAQCRSAVRPQARRRCRSCRPQRITCSARFNLRAPLGRWGLESEQRLEHTRIAAPDGRRALADTALRWLAVLHLDARDSLRAIWQGTRFVRYGSGEALPPEDSRGRVASLVAMRRFGVGRSASIGLSRQSERPAPGARRARERERCLPRSRSSSGPE